MPDELGGLRPHNEVTMPNFGKQVIPADRRRSTAHGIWENY